MGGAAYADSLQYHHCIDLWKYALELRIAKDTILYCDTCFTAQALVKLFLDLQEKHCRGLIQASVRPADVVHTIQLLLADLPSSAGLLEIAPVYKRQQESWDKVLRILSHLLLLVTQLAREPVTELPLRKSITLKTQAFFEDGGQKADLFPSLAVASLLVECGARLNATNALESTPLHTAACLPNFQ